MSGLLGNLITQVARSALDPNDAQRNPVNQRINTRRTGGLGDVLGSVLGGGNAGYNPRQYNRVDMNQLGMDDILGGMLRGQMGGRAGMGGMAGAGGLGSILGSVLGSGMGGGLGGGMARRSGMGGKGMLIAALMPMVLGFIQRNGGLSGALSKVQSLGMGNQAQSWMSNQQDNDNLDPEEVTRLFDSSEIQQVAQQTGADETEVRQGLAELFPEVVNQLTPEGGLEHEAEANQEVDAIMSQLSGMLGGRG